MTRGAELLRAVLDAPDDDAPRLVYADATMRSVRALIASPHLGKLRILHGLPFTRATEEGRLLYERCPTWVAYGR